MRRLLRTLLRLGLVVGVLLAIWFLGLVWFVGSLPTGVAEPQRKTDAVVVLTGGSLRLGEGLRLLRAGLAPKLFVSGVPSGVDLAQLLQSIDDRGSSTPCCITLGHIAADTPGNARESAVWARQEGVRSIRLVTSAYHMPRSLMEFRTAAPGIDLVPHPVFPATVRQEAWWRFPGTADLLIGEYHKCLMTWLFTRLSEPAP
ncbi:MAG: YdcF family protein [Reyranellaceae bacterium]